MESDSGSGTRAAFEEALVFKPHQSLRNGQQAHTEFARQLAAGHGLADREFPMEETIADRQLRFNRQTIV